MKKPEKAEKEWKTICILLVVVILFLIYGWHKSEQNRLKILDELETVKVEYQELYERTR